MELSEHFRELRRRLLFCLLFFAAGTAVSFYAAESLWPLVKRPLLTSDAVTLVNLSPAEGISANLLLAGLFAGLVSAPVLLYNAFAFCAPALRAERKSFAVTLLAAALVLFYLGATFAYLFAIPFLLNFLASFSDIARQMWSQAAYTSFFFRFVFLFGAAFLMPVCAVFLARAGIFDRGFLSRHFRLIVFSIVLLSALFTPPDLLSLFWMAIPLLLLYGASLVAYRIAWRKR